MKWQEAKPNTMQTRGGTIKVKQSEKITLRQKPRLKTYKLDTGKR